ncbi:poly-beta-1,6-N-acetyl-D-glucosamine N-deacetylase PgaB [Kangiella koreensis]|uniref:Polysaccharide deacetylase n=1 Tax=Kangiella koreensis (strain DSM 16069 / JCM 12317 / KCTC 12182 / SW-125) TaxID=523791 RepID=C7RBF0_KANKD|nr:poly-beta-1,6-N-acetyl-D-glucosamine N-deacetylase PgaB [Kangiella koreensis]ACV26592.1 polysaccharide deacetylase [Kangiella koreensis DSM 16069]
MSVIKKLLLSCILCVSHFASASPQSDFFALCYHDVTPNPIKSLHQDSGMVTTENLIQHFEWLKDNGYTVVSLDDIIAARSGKAPLPEKAVYLTFDDGYRSFYTQIYLLLKLYNYPATFALVTSWIESPESVQYGRILKSSNEFLTWEQIIEMQDSGLIEIASHSHNLHQGVIGNPQGNSQPAAMTRIFDGTDYESEEAYQERIRHDLKISYDLINKHTGVAPRAIVWPYGSYSGQTWEIAQEVGFKQSLVLGTGANNLIDATVNNKINKSEHISRYLISDNPIDADISTAIEPYDYKAPHRAVHIDLDYVYDPDPEQQHRNLSALLDRIRTLKVSHVYLQAFADEDGDGNASALYFPNRMMPVKADLFNRVAWQLKTRAEVKVFAWMPVSAFNLGDEFYLQHGVKEWRDGQIVPSTNNYRRLSIFSPEAQESIKSIYADLARYSYVAGVLFHDDAFLTDFEDVSPEALNYYRSHGLVFDSIDDLRSPSIIDEWTRIKTNALIDFTHELATILERYNGSVVTARNLYSQPIINRQAARWYAQDLSSFSDNYDITAVMAMPFMEQAKEPMQWLKQLLQHMEKLPNKNKVVLELQTVDWRTQSKIKEKILLEQMELFMRQGFIHFGYYPDDFINDHPRLNTIIKGISLSSVPSEETSDE